MAAFHIVERAAPLVRSTFAVRDCCSCIEAGTPPAFCKRCKDCIDDNDRPNWFPKNGADLEYLSWFPPRATQAAPAAASTKESDHG